MTKQRDIELENILIETFKLKCKSKNTDRKGAEKNAQRYRTVSKEVAYIIIISNIEKMNRYNEFIKS